MKIAITGGTGFIGRRFVAEALARGHSVLLICRSESAARRLGLPRNVDILEDDIYSPRDQTLARIASSEVCVHLAWGGLSDFQSLRHVDTELPAHLAFLRSLRRLKLPRLVVTGTCLEYGLKSGGLKEDEPTEPITSYGLAKDLLRRQLQFLELVEGGTRMAWARLFYVYGEIEHRRTLQMQLREAVLRGDKVFPMSGGEQLRDYLHVQDVAKRLLDIAVGSEMFGIFNVCSGKPISVRRLVEQWIAENNWQISLDLGRYPYPDYEPFAFWGDCTKFDTLSARTKLSERA